MSIILPTMAKKDAKKEIVFDLQQACGDSIALMRIIIAQFRNLREERWNKRGYSNIDVFWTGRQASNSNYSYTRLDPGRAISNHFPGIIDICSKARSTYQLNLFTRFFGSKVFNFFPVSYTLPAQLDMFTREYDESLTYIVKPNLGSQGHDMYLAKDMKKIEQIMKSNPERRDQPNVESGVTVQLYIDNPLLLNGVKFDFRIYVLIESLNPFKIHVYREGLARFCTESYEKPNEENLDNTYMHLTNYSLQKNRAGFHSNDEHFANGNEDMGTKRGLSVVLEQIIQQSKDTFAQRQDEYAQSNDPKKQAPKLFTTEMFWKQVDDIATKTLASMWAPLFGRMKSAFSYIHTDSSGKATEECLGRPPCTITNCRGCKTTAPSYSKSPCFNILGFDFLLDEHYKLWLLEVNARPSLNIDTAKDLAIKTGLIANSLKLLGIVSPADDLFLDSEFTSDANDNFLHELSSPHLLDSFGNSFSKDTFSFDILKKLCIAWKKKPLTSGDFEDDDNIFSRSVAAKAAFAVLRRPIFQHLRNSHFVSYDLEKTSDSHLLLFKNASIEYIYNHYQMGSAFRGADVAAKYFNICLDIGVISKNADIFCLPDSLRTSKGGNNVINYDAFCDSLVLISTQLHSKDIPPLRAFQNLLSVLERVHRQSLNPKSSSNRSTSSSGSSPSPTPTEFNETQTVRPERSYVNNNESKRKRESRLVAKRAERADKIIKPTKRKPKNRRKQRAASSGPTPKARPSSNYITPHNTLDNGMLSANWRITKLPTSFELPGLSRRQRKQGMKDMWSPGKTYVSKRLNGQNNMESRKKNQQKERSRFELVGDSYFKDPKSNNKLTSYASEPSLSVINMRKKNISSNRSSQDLDRKFFRTSHYGHILDGLKMFDKPTEFETLRSFQ